MNKWLVKFLCSLAPFQIPLLYEPIVNLLVKHGHDPSTASTVARHTVDLLLEVAKEECENANA